MGRRAAPRLPRQQLPINEETTMATTLGKDAITEIRTAMTGLKNAKAKAEAERLAARHGISITRIYALTADLRPKRKRRKDHGKTKADLLNDPGLKFAAAWVAAKKVSPELALETARANGYEINVSLGTFQRYLNKYQVSRRAMATEVQPYRDWEASAPGELGQFDWSALKTRWIDAKARKILYLPEGEVNRNHPNSNPNRLPIWRAAYRDDYSRLIVIRYYAMARPTSSEAADFLLHVYRQIGVPLKLYTDNAGDLTGKRMQRITRILNEAFADQGGYEQITHLPHNARATGKVESLHKACEEFEKLIGVKVNVPDLDGLNLMAERYCAHYNRRNHRATGEQPLMRFRASHTAMRVPPPELLNAAFKADEFSRVLKGNLTVTFEKEKLQLPRIDPFTGWIGKELSFIWFGAEAQTFVVIGLDGKDYEIARELATPHKAGEFKAVEESLGERMRKELTAHAKEIQAGHKAAQTDIITPFIDTDPAAELAAKVPVLPQRTITPEVETWARLTHAQPTAIASARTLDYWDAFDLGRAEGWIADPRSEAEQCAADKEWLRGVFGTRERITSKELLKALEQRANADFEQPQNNNVIPLQRRAG